jgi:hypothetical protein
MRDWAIGDAGARIADLHDAALREGPQRVVRADAPAVTAVSEAEWTERRGYRTFRELLAEFPLDPADLPPKRPARMHFDGEG